MDQSRLFIVGDLPGFTPQIGRLVSMMNFVRVTTFEEVQGLTVEQLDYLHDPESNSIGALLLHIAAVERVYRTLTLEDRWLTPEEFEEWKPAIELGDPGRSEIRGQELGYYLDLLERGRERTLEEFRRRDDDWLAAEGPFWGSTANNYFKWFHVFEDELNHRGQIRWLKKRALEATHSPP